MSLNARPKRRAALNISPIIDSSDSEIEKESTPAKKPRTGRRIVQVFSEKENHTQKELKGGNSKEKRTKNKYHGLNNFQPIIDLTDNQNSNVNEVGSDVVPIKATELKVRNGSKNVAAVLPIIYNNIQSQSTTERNSFWARRTIWTIPELLAETTDISPNAAKNIVQLFENENTIPFICRYRRDLVNHIEPERLREIKNSYTEIVNLRKKAETIVNQLEKENALNEDIRTEILCAKTTEELEFLYAPYKSACKGSLAERSKALGLEPYADRLLYGDAPEVRINSLVDTKNSDLDNEEKIIVGICHIVSHKICKHTGVLEELRRLQKCHHILLKATKSKTPKQNYKNSNSTTSNQQLHKNDVSKYENYYEFQTNIHFIKPHQILAINRGEKQKFLTVKLIIPDNLKNDLRRFIKGLFMEDGLQYTLRTQIFERSFEECYNKKLQPLLTRQVRGDLKEKGKKASIEVFAKNLKQLLLMSPLKGERILGIDPGFRNGCKFAVISEAAMVLETGTLYPHNRNADPEDCGEQLSKILIRHNCKLIALGNGTACRETEHWLTKLFALGILDSHSIRYSIVSEQGASIYSCSNIAKKEFPNLDMNHISAVSIARRLNDPLSEYVKIEPRHIGVGMYQHDINEKSLNESLAEVVSECVSYVGVDINTASLSVLKYIAGLSEKKADKIIKRRLEKGPFRTRQELLSVKSIGEKTYTQCAGFVRIDPHSLGGAIDNLLDCTWVHPESYGIAKIIIAKCQLNLKDIGSEPFIEKIKDFYKTCDLQNLADDFSVPKERLEIVLQALQRELFQDFRSDFDKKPLFKQGLTRISELSKGDLVTGAVTNITHFGAFVDIGVDCAGLIHINHIKNFKLNIGDRVVSSIIQVDVPRKRIGLYLEELIH